MLIRSKNKMNMLLLVLTVLLGFMFTAVNSVEYFEPAGAKIVSRRTGPISGDCWQGELCKQRCLINATIARFVGSINYKPVCCPFCERSGLEISNSKCNCRHNGPDPTYVPTEQELREVEAFKNRLNSAVTPGASVCLTAGLLLVSSLALILPK